MKINKFRKNKIFSKIIFPIILSLGMSSLGMSISHANTPYDLRDLVDVRASSGEGELRARGYRHIRTEQGDDRTWNYWYRQSNNTCVNVTTFNGRFDSIKESTSDCGDVTSGKSNAAAAVGAALAIGAIAALTKHEHDKEKKYEREHETNRSESSAFDWIYGMSNEKATKKLEQQGFRFVKQEGNYYWWVRKSYCVKFRSVDGIVADAREVDTEECQSDY